MRKPFYFLFASLLLFSYLGGGGCSDSSITDDEPASVTNNSGSGGGGTVVNPPASMVVSITPSSGLSALGTATVSAAVRDAAGAVVADGTTVTFIVSSSALGSITPTATTVSGVANATFTASNTAGTVGITVTSGVISASANITVQGANVGSVEFTSASPTVVGVKGSGQTESSLITFTVKDENGQAVADGTTVTLSLTGPNGGETIAPTTASTTGGQARTTLQSGSVPGPVTIVATVTTSGGQALSSSSSPISIGGGIPSATHFNLATTKFNLPGLAVSNSQAQITGFIADRFGNFNVLTGTSVSFYTEAGAIDRSDLTDTTGIAFVTFRTQAPDPAEVAISAAETTMINSLNATYALTIPTDGSVNPSDGYVTVVATVQGEESFSDANANGRYDTGESFTDLGEPFIDKNDDGCRNSGTTRNCSGVVAASTEPFEEFIDANGNGSYDGPNGVWDGPGCAGAGCQTVKTIWTSRQLAFTGNAAFCELAGNTTVPDGDTVTYTFMVGDLNTNQLISGATIGVALTGAGTLGGQTSYTIPDGIPSGPTVISFSISDAEGGDTDAPEAFTITVTVTSNTPQVVGCVLPTSGFVD